MYGNVCRESPTKYQVYMKLIKHVWIPCMTEINMNQCYLFSFQWIIICKKTMSQKILKKIPKPLRNFHDFSWLTFMLDFCMRTRHLRLFIQYRNFNSCIGIQSPWTGSMINNHNLRIPRSFQVFHDPQTLKTRPPSSISLRTQSQWTNILKGVYRAHTEFLHEFEHHTADVNLPGDSQRHIPLEVSHMHLQFPCAVCIAAIWHSYTIQRHPLQTVS